jgi:hypothetical protein
LLRREPARAGRRSIFFSNPVHQLLAATAILSGQSLATGGNLGEHLGDDLLCGEPAASIPGVAQDDDRVKRLILALP